MGAVTDNPNPAALAPYDPAWPLMAVEQLALVRGALAGLPGADTAQLDHIGSTSVPGLAAKPFLDLQVRILPLPEEAELIDRLEPIGYQRAPGARPDSPGVHRDIPRGGEDVPPEVWQKRLFVCADVPAILHVRRLDSPWGRYTVAFRDWLRANPDQRDRYARVKTALAEENRGKADYDDYTLAKTAFFDEVQDAFAAFSASAD